LTEKKNLHFFCSENLSGLKVFSNFSATLLMGCLSSMESLTSLWDPSFISKLGSVALTELLIVSTNSLESISDESPSKHQIYQWMLPEHELT